MGHNSTDKYWSDYYAQGLDFISITSQELRQFLAHISKEAPKTVLDIGCGTGQLTRELYHSGFRVLGIDVSRAALQVARSLTVMSGSQLRYEHHGIEKTNLAKLPFAPYGLITCQSVYAFIDDKERLLAEVKRALAPTGTFVIISQLRVNVPKHKKLSAIDADTTITALQKHFKVHYYEKAKLGYFICAKK